MSRTCIGLTVLILIGVLAMADTATADEKKDPPKKKPDPAKKESYDEKVTLRIWQGDKFSNPVGDVLMFRWEISGKPVMYLWWPGMTIRTPKGSELIDKDGVTWIVGVSKRGMTDFLCYVAKKP